MALPLIPLVAGATAIGGGMNLASGILQNAKAEQAARENNRTLRRQMDLIERMNREGLQRLDPFVDAGKNAISQYNNLLAGWQQPTMDYVQKDFSFDTFRDPGAQHRMARAMKALENSSLAKGRMGGGFAKAAMAKNQELASDEFKNSYERFLADSNLRYGQAKDKYDRDFNFTNTRIDKYGNLINTGANAAGNAMSGNMQTASTGSAAYSNIMDKQNTIRGQQATNIGNTMGNVGNSLLQGLGQISGTDFSSMYGKNKKEGG